MKAKGLIVSAIIFGLLTIALSWISGSDRFDIEFPWFIVSAPSTLFFIVFLLPYAIREDKNKKDKE